MSHRPLPGANPAGPGLTSIVHPHQDNHPPLRGEPGNDGGSQFLSTEKVAGDVEVLSGAQEVRLNY